jgi:hypothetical protein
MTTPPTLKREVRALFTTDQRNVFPVSRSTEFSDSPKAYAVPESLTMFSLREIFREMEING